MAIQQISPVPWWASITPHPGTGTSTAATMDAAGESTAAIGTVVWRGATNGSTKTLSAAGGGSIVWRSAASVTFSNASSNFRIGAGPLSGATEAGTYDVRADLVGGTDTIASSTWIKTAMETGTKTFTYGTDYALILELTARGGADSVTATTAVRVTDSGFVKPYRTVDTGSGPAVSTANLVCFIVFDDGTVGWFHGAPFCTNFGSFASAAINTGTTPDEYAAIFQVACTMEIGAMLVYIGGVATTDSFEVILYSDPLGTPTVIETVSPSATVIGSTGASVQPYLAPLATPRTLSAGTNYAVAVRPTTANSINYGYMQPGTNIGRLMKHMTPFASGTLKLGTRSDQTGAFSETDQDDIPAVAIYPTGFDDGLQPVARSLITRSIGTY